MLWFWGSKMICTWSGSGSWHYSYKLSKLCTCAESEKQQCSLLQQQRWITLGFNLQLKQTPSCYWAPSVPRLLGQSPLLTSFGCLAELTGSGWFYVWSVTASYYPITSVHPSCPHAEPHGRKRHGSRAKQSESRVNERGKRNTGTRTPAPVTNHQRPGACCQDIQIWTQAFWLLIIPLAWSKLNLWHCAGAPCGIIN